MTGSATGGPAPLLNSRSSVSFALAASPGGHGSTLSPGVGPSPQRAIKELSKMLEPRAERAFEFGPFRLDLRSRLLLRQEDPVPLTPKALDLLRVLVERRHQVVTKDELLEAVWPDTFVEEATLTQNIYTLRKALGNEGTPYIETMPRRGYRFTGPVHERPQARIDGPEQVEGRVETLAVLPFQTLGVEGDRELFGLGMADALITRLSALRDLTVRPTGAVARYASSVAEPVAAGRELGVDAVVEGTVQKAGSRLRVSVRLVGVTSKSALWAEKFDSVYSDIFTVQDSISLRIAETLHFELSSREQRRLTRKPTADTRAYEAFIEGRYLWNRRTGESLAKAIGCFERALELDPGSALAHAGLADAQVLLPLYGDAAPGEVFPKARAAARRALELDPDLAEAMTSLAYTRFVHDWQWEEAEHGFQRALGGNPNYATAHQWYGFLLAALGRHEEALFYASQACSLDPFSVVIRTDMGFVLYFGRRHQEALGRHLQTLEMEPGFAYAHFGAALALSALDRHEEAVLMAERAADLSQRNSAMVAALGFCLAMAGRLEEARWTLEEIRNQAEHGAARASRLAIVLAGMGEVEEAMVELERAIVEKSRFVAFLGVWPVFDRLRSHPAFAGFLARLGLEPHR